VQHMPGRDAYLDGLLVLPETRKSIRRKRGISRRALQIPMPEIVGKAPGIVSIIGQLEPAGVPEHMRVHRKW
jgi:hypothetical protein